MKAETVEAGCLKCKQRFYLAIDPETGQPIWSHLCPETTDEKLDRIAKLLEERSENRD